MSEEGKCKLCGGAVWTEAEIIDAKREANEIGLALNLDWADPDMPPSENATLKAENERLQGIINSREPWMRVDQLQRKIKRLKEGGR